MSDEYKEFGDFWFIRGGMLHRLWKTKQYTAIKDLAYDLPKAAWDARQHEIDALKAEVAQYKKALAENEGRPSVSLINDLSKKIREAVKTLEYAKGQLQHAGYTKNAVPVVEKTLANLQEYREKPAYVPNDEEKT